MGQDVSLLLTALVVVLGLPSPAHPTSDPIIDFWDSGRGLPGTSATAIAQTREGFLWVGTYNGLSRFDGVRFVTFDPFNTPSLKHSRVERLFTDEAGTLWINTHDGSLTAWRNGSFSLEWTGREPVDTGVWLASSRPDEQVLLLQTGVAVRRELREGRPGPWQTLRPTGTTFQPVYCATRSGEVWVRSADGRLWRLARGRCEAVSTSPRLSGRTIHCLATDGEDRVWVGTDLELGVWNGSEFARATPANGEPRIDATFLHFTGDGSFWAVANRRLRKARGQRWVLEIDAARPIVEAALWRLSAVDDQRGGIWFAHDGRGLLHVSADGTARPFGPADGFASGRVKALFLDQETNLWVGTDRGGLARLRERRFQIVGLPGRTPACPAVSLSEDRHGSIWIGTLGAGLLRWRDGTITAFPLSTRATRPFVFSVAPDRHDRLWLSADNEDLWLFEAGSARPAPWPVHGIKALLVDRAGRVWMGRKDGLSCWSEGKLESYAPARGIGSVDVRALAEDEQGAIWIGGGDGSIHRLVGERFTSIPLPHEGPPHPVWSLLADRDGVVWAGTHRGGLLRLKDGRVTHYTARDGLSSDVVCQLVDDDLGHLWVGSPEGILRIAKDSLGALADGRQASLRSSSYGRADGIPSLECSGYQPTSWRGRDGRLWFATVGGAVSASPRDLHDDRAPPVVIEEVWVDHERRGADTLWAAPAPAGADAGATGAVVTVPPGTRQIEFRYSGLSLRAPEAVRFRYRLEGLEGEWVEAGVRRSSQYSYLPPGDYRFRVIACNSDGVWNEAGASLSLKVLPQIWETWWFRGLVAAVALALVAGIARRVATRGLRRSLERLERQQAVEHDRARIARDIHDGLGAGLTQISLLSELVRSDAPQEARAHVAQIAETAAELTRAMDEIVWAVSSSDDTLDSLWGYLSHFAQEYLGTAGIHCRLDAPEPLPTLPLAADVRHNVFLAVKEILNNVVKHADAREVRLDLAPGERQFELEIRDDGRGLGAAPRPADQRAASGLGLANIAERMLAIGGRCEVCDEPSGGTRVRLIVAIR